jgi:DNA-binding MarR family transcriptional regulator
MAGMPEPEPAPPHPPHPPRRLWTLPSWLASQLAAQGDRVVTARLAELELRKPHFTTLVALDESGPASQAHLGRVLMMDRSDLHAIVATLDERGLVTRVRDAVDRRRNVVEITAAGRTALEAAGRAVDDAQRELLAPLSPAEQTQLTALLTRLAEHHRQPASEG